MSAASLSREGVVLPRDCRGCRVQRQGPIGGGVVPIVSIQGIRPLVRFIRPVLELSYMEH